MAKVDARSEVKNEDWRARGRSRRSAPMYERGSVRPAIARRAIEHRMPRRMLERIREAVRLQRYDITKHAVDELAEDGLDIVDLETAILNGRLTKTEKDDPRGARYTIHGIAADGSTPVGSAGRFTETGRYLIITAYEVSDE